MDDKVFISSRIRLARNIVEYPFPNRLDSQTSKEIVDNVFKIINNNSALKDDFNIYKMNEISENEKQILVENHSISKDLTKNKEGAVLIKTDNTLSIMINEEDHLRIQGIFKGFKLDEAWELVDKIDDLLEEELTYAFDEHIGYLTSCPTNVGTGLRASLMLHLPALVELGYISDVLDAANQIGLAVRGIYGEGSQSLGSIYQISNQLTLGRKEEEIIGNITAISKQVADREMEGRDVLKNKLGIRLEDRFFRSLALLQNCRIIDSKEAMNLLSDVKLGIEMGYIDNIKSNQIDDLMVNIQPAHQKSIYNSDNIMSRDINRAKFIREKLTF